MRVKHFQAQGIKIGEPELKKEMNPLDLARENTLMEIPAVEGNIKEDEKDRE